MYESFFNLTAKPFDLLPNPDFLFMSRAHKRACMYLDYGIRERAGFILLTGNIGTGKTTIIRNLLKQRDDRIVFSRIFNTRVDADQLFAMIADDFGIATSGKDKVTLLRELNDYLIEQFAAGRQPVLIIDEAQNLGAELLEEIRMLSNLETDNAKLLQIILVGQPELRATLADPGMVQFRQRININCNLTPLSVEEMRSYIFHRLEVAGNRDAVEFASEALEIVHRYSRGIPRLINIICDFIMLSAFAEETRQVAGEMVQDIVGDLDFERNYWNPACADVSPQPVDAAPPPPEPYRDELSSLLRDLGHRLETLENGLTKLDPELFVSMNDRFSRLENAFTFHVGEVDSYMAELRKELEKVRSLSCGSPVERDEELLPRSGLIRRLFGG